MLFAPKKLKSIASSQTFMTRKPNCLGFAFDTRINNTIDTMCKPIYETNLGLYLSWACILFID
jgi:hypothetical protein